MRIKLRLLGLIYILLSVPSIASANAGVPMIFITMPGMLVALIPVIAIEMFAIRSILRSEWREAAIASAVSNACSTLVGVPLAWGAFLLFEMAVGIPSGYLNINPSPFLQAILFAAWLGPDENNLHWMVPLSAMVLLVWFFYVSYWIERIVGKQLLKKHAVDQISKAFWRANVVSYILLELVTVGFLVYALIAKRI